MNTIFAVMYSTRYDGPDDIIQLYYRESDAIKHLQELLKQPYTSKTDFYISEYDII